MISDKLLAKISSPAVLARAQGIANRGNRISNRHVSYQSKGDLLLSARVRGTGGREAYTTTARINEGEGTVLGYTCTCPASSSYPGACKHSIALVIDFELRAQSYGGFDPTRDVKTSPCITSYLDGADERAESLVAADGGARHGSIALIPTLIEDYDGWSIRFSIKGDSTAYVVKSLSELVDNVEGGVFVRYGKSLAFTHTRAAFEERSQHEFDLLERAVQIRRVGAGGARWSYYAAPIERDLTLSTPELFDFLTLFLGESLQVQSGQSARSGRPLRVIDGDPELPLSIEPFGPSAWEVKRQGTWRFLSSEGEFWAQDDVAFYRCSDKLAKIAPFLEGVYAADQSELVVSDEDMPRFCSTVLPQTEHVLDVTLPPEVEALRPASCTVRFYFDRAKDAAVCVGYAVYEDKNGEEHRLNLLDDAPSHDIMRNLAAECQALGVCDRYLDRGDSTFFVSSKDQKRMATLLFEGVRALSEIGTVFTTPAFDRLAAKTQPRVTIGVSIKSNLIDLNVDTVGFPPDELHAILSSYQQKKAYHRMRDGSYLDLRTADLDQASELESALGLTSKELASGDVKLPAYRAFEIDALLDDDQKDASFNGWLDDFHQVDDSAFDVPRDLAGTLRPYQVTGYRWLATLSDLNMGGILADEMGLGKSIQLIALLLHAKEQRAQAEANATAGAVAAGAADVTRTVGPADAPDTARTAAAAKTAHTDASADEAAKAAGSSAEASADDEAPASSGRTLVVCPASLVYNWMAEFSRFAPTIDAAAVAGSPDERAAVRANPAHEVLVTSYDLAKRDLDAYRAETFDYLVIDEAQYIKNAQTQVARAVKSIPSEHRIALTGTPVENRLSELWSIFDFLMPGLLGTYKRFRDRFEEPIVNGDDDAREHLRAAVAPFILRRLKKDVLRDLPDKFESVVYVHMAPEQRKLYEAREQLLRSSLKKTGDEALRTSKLQVLAEITRLRQICCDPRLLYSDYAGDESKIDAICDLVSSSIDAHQKVLVFSQFTSFLELIGKRFEKEGFDYYTITGATPKLKRVQLVNAFNDNDVPVFLISLKAGGTGLNLTGASVVVHADPWWNAAAENQATDRAHRIGQKNEVSVFKVIQQDTIEERIVKLQEAKRDIADKIVSSDNVSISSLSREDLMELLGE